MSAGKAAARNRPDRSSLTLEYLKSVLSYDPQTGQFHWIANKWEGRPAGTVNSDGYIKIVVRLIDFKAHRLAWAFANNEMPPKAMHIDHINGIKTDNRLANLRLCTAKQNCENAKRHKSNTVGLKGVSTCGNRFRAYICHNRKQHHLGVFSTPDEAHQAYCRAAIKLGWQVHRQA
jgi:hypothetical protein